jgi:hypothetical protein
MISENTLIALNPLYGDLLIAKELVYDKLGFDFTDLEAEPESIEYGACTFKLNGISIIHRVSKITPAKTGQFVTTWRRNINGITEPFHISDDIGFIIITSRSGDNFGQFIFPKSVLLDKRIISCNNKEGKRGIRVYPPWDKATNKQAGKTQNWQTEYFLKIPNNKLTDLTLIKQLLKKAEDHF